MDMNDRYVAGMRRAADIARTIGETRANQAKAAKVEKKRTEFRDFESMAMSAFDIAATISAAADRA